MDDHRTANVSWNVLQPHNEDVIMAVVREGAQGCVLALFGRIPLVSDSTDWLGYRLEVIDMDGRRIDKVLIQPLQE